MEENFGNYITAKITGDKQALKLHIFYHFLQFGLYLNRQFP
jgi:hypothetical protein